MALSGAESIADNTGNAVTGVVAETTGFKGCFGCAKCTAGCPAAEQMDITPHQMMRLLQLGRLDEVMTSASLWKCVGCQTCLARCPNDVDIPMAIISIRIEAVSRGLTEHAKDVLYFDELMLGMIRRRGRVNDGVMALRYKLHAGVGGMIKDWRVGMKMFKAGKLKLTIPGVDDTDSVRRLFDKPAASTEDDR